MGNIEQRAAYRFPADLEAECRSCSRSWSSRLCNISSTGCMIVCPEPGLPDGALLRIRLRGLTAIDGTIIWQHRGHAGVRFVNPLHQAMMQHLGFEEPEAAGPVHAAARTAQGQAAPRRAAGGLHSQLVKRIWLVAPEGKLASAG
jgi:hypothetical protein